MVQSPRTIQPGDAQDERLAGVPLSAAYTYAYLPTVLDDEGRANDQPAVFNGYLWPLRADEHPTAAMASDLSALVDAGLLCRYSVGGHDYLHDPDWKRRQQVARAGRSTLPRCPTHDVTFDDAIGETLNTISEQVSAAFDAAAAKFDPSRIRDTVARMVEDVTFPVDPEKAASYGQKIREFMGREQEQVGESSTGPSTDTDTDAGTGEGAADVKEVNDVKAGNDVKRPGVWRDVTDDPR